ncbi:MAG: SAV_915 family protein [Nocardioides sp.]
MNEVPLPPVVYAPTLRDDDGNTRIRMHKMRDDRVALFVYSAIDRLEAQYGAGTPWVLLGPGQLERAHEASPFDLLLLDRELYPAEAAHG